MKNITDKFEKNQFGQDQLMVKVLAGETDEGDIFESKIQGKPEYVLVSITRKVGITDNIKILERSIKRAEELKVKCHLHCPDYDNDKRELIEINEFMSMFCQCFASSEYLKSHFDKVLQGDRSTLCSVFIVCIYALIGEVKREGRKVNIYYNGEKIAEVG